MWKDYSVQYLKYNKASGIFIIVVAFLSSMLLSFFSVLFYNLLMDRRYQWFLKHGTYEEPVTLLLAAYLCLLITASFALILMLHNAFEVTMNARLHQLGILQSVGATPTQIKSVLASEAVILSLFSLLAGTVTGIGLCYVVWKAAETATESFRYYEIQFYYHFLLSAVSLFLSFLTVGMSAWIPARKLSRISPLEAIQCGSEQPLKRMKQFCLISSIFGVYGELARKSIYARKKEFRTSFISITLSFLVFVSFLNVETLSGISTQRTYFEKYRNTWDFLLTMDEKECKEQELLSQIRKISGVQSCIFYKKIPAFTLLSEDRFSPELKSLGIGNLNETIKADADKQYPIDVPIYVLDNDSFYDYYSGAAKLALQPEPEILAINKIWDSVNSEYLNREYLPFLDTEAPVTLELSSREDSMASIVPVTVTSYTDVMPQLKEEFQQYSLTLVTSEAFFQSIEDHFANEEVYFNIKTSSEKENVRIGKEVERLMGQMTGYQLDSRLEEEASETRIREALRMFMGFLAVLFSSIGLTNVFSAVLGQIHQRKREFARYMSVGLSPKGIRRILLMETFIICFRPVLISVAVNIPLVLFMADAGGISLTEYFPKAPFIPIAVFTAFILFFVGLAYYLGARKIRKGNIMDTLKDDTMI